MTDPIRKALNGLPKVCEGKVLRVLGEPRVKLVHSEAGHAFEPLSVIRRGLFVRGHVGEEKGLELGAALKGLDEGRGDPYNLRDLHRPHARSNKARDRMVPRTQDLESRCARSHSGSMCSGNQSLRQLRLRHRPHLEDRELLTQPRSPHGRSSARG